ncbi:ASCH domain-containing protein [Deinococcus arenicola]|uniref:ASCH domain-containing protein n=1 Tax=Deinococcus arenicola TaxID=2994950 RepID=A0ABU4DMF4_9DEIO|nr:ASCH domain-containing protein [Deinococcus sp. ZS9-10]MDV6373070.1 ASCH domain-containing protein [Deinococcus sp. ZS9-10]
MTRIKEGLALLLEDLEEHGRVELDAGSMGGYFGERPLSEKQMDTVNDALNANGFSVATLYVIYRDVDGYRSFTPPAAPEPLDLGAGSIRALSIRQPFVEQILSGEKNIEYRSWQIQEPGPLLLHASSIGAKPEDFDEAGIAPDTLPYGALVGIVDVVDCLWDEENEEFEWLLAYPRRFSQPIEYKGAARIFNVPVEDIQAALSAPT